MTGESTFAVGAKESRCLLKADAPRFWEWAREYQMRKRLGVSSS